MLQIENTVTDSRMPSKGSSVDRTQLRKESESWDTQIGTSQTEMQGEKKITEY